jgi:uncharacterized protein (DUF433 family)
MWLLLFCSRNPMLCYTLKVTVQVVDRHISITPGLAGGKPHITGHRITVQDVVVWHEHLGKTTDEISTEYGLTLSEIHAALSYYFDHQDEINESLQQHDTFIKTIKAQFFSLRDKKLSNEL